MSLLIKYFSLYRADYGFVESYPQTWIFQDVTWELEDDEEGNFRVTWLEDSFPDEETIDEMMAQVQRLESLGQEKFTEQPEGLPDSEWQMALRFYNAYLTALREGAEAASREGSCLEKKECRLTNDRYNALDNMFNEEGYNRYVCEIDWGFPGYEQLEVVQSNYQKLTYIMDEENRDVCFSLEETWQQCGSYRPHYHEMMVHYPARFFPKLKRVLWVGGGDSLLLHEIVKYPDLELAVGLELDQQVTRSAFKVCPRESKHLVGPTLSLLSHRFVSFLSVLWKSTTLGPPQSSVVLRRCCQELTHATKRIFWKL